MPDQAIWLPFLTERDKVLAAAHERASTGLGCTPALILIDIYERVFGDRREPLLDAIGRFPASCGPAAWDALPRIEAVLSAFREHGLPVVHFTGASDIPGWRSARGGAPVDRAALEEAYRIRPEVAPEGDEPVIRKAAPSAFSGTPLPGLLRQWDADAVVVVGESTSGCVRASVVDGRSNRFKMTVLEDCVFDRTEAAHAMNLFDMAQKYADVRPSAEVIAELARRSRNA